MIYLALNENTVKLLSLSKNLFGQYNLASFQKTHTARLLEKGQVTTVDLVASAVKEALTLAVPAKVKEKEVCLILPQKAFEFARYDVPADIDEGAIKPFLEDKIRAQTDFTLDDVLYDYLLVKQEAESKLLFFALRREVFTKYWESLKLLGLTVNYLVPDTICYFTLFAKTLRREKKETILYVFHQDKVSHGYLYDSLGLLQAKAYRFEDPIETSLHETAGELAKKEIKLNRIVLSGVKSENIRQDLFTKKVAVWTNPLKKIITNFYQDYLQLLASGSQTLPLLDFDVCFGAFVAYCEHNVFSVKEMNKKTPKPPAGRKAAPALPRLPIHPRDIVVFFISFLISFAVIFFYPRVKPFIQVPGLPKQAKPTSTPSPTAVPTPTPTPTVDRAVLAIKVLNGTGIAGRAADVREILLDKGYGEIVTDNADNFDYEMSELQAKEDQKDSAEILKRDLADYVTLKTISSLDADSSADLILIIGRDFE